MCIISFGNDPVQISCISSQGRKTGTRRRALWTHWLCGGDGSILMELPHFAHDMGHMPASDEAWMKFGGHPV